MKHTLTLAAMLCGATLAAHADTITIATGKQGGGYDRRAQEISQRLEQRGLETTVQNLNGSDEISLAICQGRADIGPMQIDAIYARAMEGCTLKPVAVYGSEFAFILFPPGSDADELEDLTPQSAVLVDTIGSGSDLFWRTIVRIETGEDGDGDEWSAARVVNDPLELAHASATMGDIHAVVLVRKPDSADVLRLIDLGWSLGQLWDRDIDDLQFNGQPLYAGQKVALKWGNKTVKNYAYQVRSLIVASPKIADGNRQSFAAITAAAQ